MLIKYRSNEVQKTCEDEKFARKSYPDKIVSSIELLIYKLASVTTFNEFKDNPTNKKYKIHNMLGQSKDMISLRLDYQYRMTVKLKVEENSITIWEISNHYGD